MTITPTEVVLSHSEMAVALTIVLEPEHKLAQAKTPELSALVATPAFRQALLDRVEAKKPCDPETGNFVFEGTMPRPKASPEHQAMTGGDHAQPKVTTSANRGGRPKCPRHLSKAAKVEWRRALGELEERKVLTKGDYTLLAVYAEVFARWIAAKTAIGEAYGRGNRTH